MTFAELLTYIDTNTDLPILKGSVEATLNAASDAGEDDYASEIIRTLSERLDVREAGAALPERTAVINALGKTRLKYFADDAPAEGLRFVEKFIAAIDAAYNEEALREQGK